MCTAELSAVHFDAGVSCVDCIVSRGVIHCCVILTQMLISYQYASGPRNRMVQGSSRLFGEVLFIVVWVAIRGTYCVCLLFRHIGALFAHLEVWLEIPRNCVFVVQKFSLLVHDAVSRADVRDICWRHRCFVVAMCCIPCRRLLSSVCSACVFAPQKFHRRIYITTS